MTDEMIFVTLNPDMTLNGVNLPHAKVERWLYVHVGVMQGDINYRLRRFKIRNLGRFNEINSLLRDIDPGKTFWFGRVVPIDYVLYEMYIMKLLIESSVLKQVEKKWKSIIETPSV